MVMAIARYSNITESIMNGPTLKRLELVIKLDGNRTELSGNSCGSSSGAINDTQSNDRQKTRVQDENKRYLLQLREAWILLQRLSSAEAAERRSCQQGNHGNRIHVRAATYPSRTARDENDKFVDPRKRRVRTHDVSLNPLTDAQLIQNQTAILLDDIRELITTHRG